VENQKKNETWFLLYFKSTSLVSESIFKARPRAPSLIYWPRCELGDIQQFFRSRFYGEARNSDVNFSEVGTKPHQILGKQRIVMLCVCLYTLWTIKSIPF